MRAFILILTLAVGLAGCTYQASSGREMTQDALSRLVVNQTTKAEMVAMFGPPLSHGYDSSGKLMASWHYFTTKIRYMSYNPQSRSQMLSALFNEQEVLEKYTITDNPEAGPRMGP